MLACCLPVRGALAQADSLAAKRITIVYGGTFTKDESLRPGASIFSKDNRQVQFEHQGADLWCDYALLYQKENRLEAIGNVRMQQGDSVIMSSGFVEYDGNLKLAKAYEAVQLTNRSMTLTTATLYLDRQLKEAYYDHHGRIVDSALLARPMSAAYAWTSRNRGSLPGGTPSCAIERRPADDEAL